MPAEGVRDNHDNQLCTTLPFRPLLKDFGTQYWKIVQQVSMLLEDRPQNIRHSEHHTHIRDVGKRVVHLLLPAFHCPLSANRTTPGFASVKNNLFFMSGSVDFRPQRWGSTSENSMKIVTHCLSNPRMIPMLSGFGQNLF
jgi:hypothetical protein